MSDLARTSKSWLEKPEGKTGLGFLVLGGIALAYGLTPILNMLKEFMQSLVGFLGWMMAAGVMAGLLTVTVMVVSDQRFRTLCSYLFKSSMRALTGLVIEMDPIGILRGYVADLRKKRENMEESMADLDGQISKLTDKIDRKEAERQHSLRTAQQAQKQDMKAAMVLQSRKAGRLQKSALTLQGLLEKMKGMRRVLQKMHETADFMVQDMESEIEVKADERAAILATHGAFKSAKAIIAGDTDAKAVYDQALEFLAEDYSSRVGEVESFIKSSQGFIQTVDLENGVYEQDALEQFEAWEKKADVLMLGTGEVNPLTSAINATPRQKVYANTKTGETPSGTFTDLFGKD